MYGTAKYQLPAGGKSRTSRINLVGIGPYAVVGNVICAGGNTDRYMTVDGVWNISSGSVRIHDSVDVFCVRATQCYSYFLSVRPVNEGRSIIKKLNSLFIFIGALFSLLLFSGPT